MAEYTKGPWKAEAYNLKFGSLISYGNIATGESVAIALAQIDASKGNANAHLIAAAPAMFEALKAIEECKGKCLLGAIGDRAYEFGSNAAFNQCAEIARAALAKAVPHE